MSYLPRLLDSRLDQLMAELPAVSIEGAKAIGKTATAERRAASQIRLDEPEEVALLEADRDRVSRLPLPLLIDEWQRYPPVWDAVRRSVDRDPSPGHFLLTGSALPSTVPTHSGAGRIVRVHMRPLSLAERRLTTPSVSLGDLLTGRRPAIDGDSTVGIEEYASEITRSGFPAIRRFAEGGRYDALDGYLARIVERDFADQGHPVRRPATLRSWLSAYAAATATTAAYGAILDAATAGDADKPAKTTVLAYREVLSQLWLLEPLPAWLPGGGRLARLSQAPKHHLCDPALAARLLGVDADALLTRAHPAGPVLRDGPLLGALFESLVTQSLRVYAQLHRSEVHHLRTQRGDHEVDLVVVRGDGRVVALEVKLAPTVTDAEVRHLLWLRDRLGDDLLDAAVVTTGRAAYRRPDGIAVIPAALLGP